MNRKVICLLVSLITVLAFGFPAYAETSQDVDLEGSVAAINMVDVIVPAKMTFTINSDRELIAPNYNIINNSGAPVTIYAKSIAAAKGNYVKVVAPDKFSSWAELTNEQTIHNIAIGLKQGTDSSNLVSPLTNTIWFSGEGEQTEQEVATISGDEHSILCLQPDVKYGKKWNNVSKAILTYNMILRIE